ncbi:MAG: hypothetical protein LH702_04355 [Phormidesmis sp. CAN_BIN44]|nr:hypothetical protein [Phormidesmis sp. CAN_BIN44]
MTSQIDPIQTLIDHIDGTLSKTVSRLPWAASGQISQQRQVLQQVRDYLVRQRSLASSAQTTQKSAALNQSEASAQEVMQSMIHEMNELRSTLLRPLQSEVITLTQQRNALMREVRQLEAHKQSQLLDQSSNLSDLTSSQVDQLQTVHDRADQVLGTLDTTLRVVFESLQQDIEAYQHSLSQGLDKLHGLGEQGETLVTALVSRLAQELGRGASSYLQAQEVASRDLPSQSTPTQAPSLISRAIAPNLSQTVSDSTKVSLPYPGTELPPTQSSEILFSESDSIHTLTDLLEQLTHETEDPSILAATPYIPEEDLLPQPLFPQNAALDLQLDQSILNQLSEELSRLEDEGASSSHLTLPQSSSSIPPNVVKLVGMDDLFVDESSPFLDSRE